MEGGHAVDLGGVHVYIAVKQRLDLRHISVLSGVGKRRLFRCAGTSGQAEHEDERHTQPGHTATGSKRFAICAVLSPNESSRTPTRSSNVR